jgi:hypothetical protein
VGVLRIDGDLLSSKILHAANRIGRNHVVFRPTVAELGQVNKILVVFCPAGVEVVVVAGNQINVTIFKASTALSRPSSGLVLTRRLFFSHIPACSASTQNGA